MTVWNPLPASSEGPPIQVVIRRLLGTPEDFLAADVDTVAIVSDALDLVAPGPVPSIAADLLPQRLAAQVASWLITDPALIAALGPGRRETALAAIESLRDMIDGLPLEAWRSDDPQRQEEVARAVFRALGLRPNGESHPVAEDRWASINTVARREALRQAAIEQKRAQELADKLAADKAREAAAQYTNV